LVDSAQVPPVQVQQGEVQQWEAEVYLNLHIFELKLHEELGKLKCTSEVYLVSIFVDSDTVKI